MTNNFVDLEKEIKNFLIENGITGQVIYLQKFAEDAVSEAIMLKTDAIAPPIPIEVPIDGQRIQITTRHTHPKDALDKALEIANLIHGLTPGKLHATSSVFLLSAVIDERPQRVENSDLDLPQFTAFYLFRVKPLT